MTSLYSIRALFGLLAHNNNPGRIRALLQGDMCRLFAGVRNEDRAQEYSRQEPGAPKGACERK